MWIMAFSLGILGSLHCVGMCGPIAVSFCGMGNDKWTSVYNGLSYNIGRTITYIALGLIFGVFSSFILVSGFQKVLSILCGVILIIIFILSVDLDSLLLRSKVIKSYYARTQSFIGNVLSKDLKHKSFKVGLVNGLLPCGLVYLALAGAISTGSVIGGAAFMALFGLGTIPMMFALIVGSSWIGRRGRNLFRKVFPLATLAIGVFLIYRGFVVEVPLELNFWEAVKSPIMCH